MSEFKNVMPSKGGKVHKVIRSLWTEGPGRACEETHNPYATDPNGWFGWWIKAMDSAPIDCKSCLRKYWPDGRKRVRNS